MSAFQLPGYDIHRLLGKGGMARVWKAQRHSDGKWVAVKVLLPSAAASKEDIERFRREVRVATSIAHPGIVRVYTAFFNEGMCCCVMEYVDGYTFGSLLMRKGRLAFDDVLIIAESVAVALKYAWDQCRLIHCDIKPDNIMVGSDGEVKLTDLGLCHAQTFFRGTLTVSESDDEIIGTPAYMSPEQIYADVELDCRSDIYSLGATLYHLSTGRMLFTDDDPNKLVRCHVDMDAAAPNVCTIAPDVGVGFARMLEKMLVKDADRRHRSWDEVLEDIALIRAGGIPAALPHGVASSMRAWER